MTGGGSLGSVIPLLGLQHDLLHNGIVCVWAVTRHGPENSFVHGTKYVLPVAKLPRYLSLHLLALPFLLIYSFFKSLIILRKERPHLIMSAGSYLGVPMVLAGKLLSIPSLLHQQDIIPSFSNTLVHRFAELITVNFPESAHDFPRHNTLVIGNPLRTSLFTVHHPRNTTPLILVLGGGQGSSVINTSIRRILDDITPHAEIIHNTGKGKHDHTYDSHEQYTQHELLKGEEMAEYLQRAWIVITRAGLSTLTELAYTHGCAVVIPITHSHQEHNANYLASHDAAVVLREQDLSHASFPTTILSLLANEPERIKKGENLSKLFNPHANLAMVKVIKKLLQRDSQRN